MAQRTVPIDPGRAALILVDIQPDFMPGGALPVGEGNRILEPVRSLMGTGAFGTLVATQDWHPPGHISFASSHNGRRPFETLDLHGYEQTLWPDHCVKGTPGAALHPHLPWERVSLILRKGTDPGIDSYSGFRENRDAAGTRPSTGLAGYLRERGARDLFLCGLARDVCVRWTAEDGADEGFRVFLLWDLTRPVDATSDPRVRADLERHGVAIVTLEQLSLRGRASF